MATATASATAHLKPLGDKVIVEVLGAQDRTKGGIILPDTAKEKPQEAKVIAVGSGKILNNGKELLIINQDDILAVIK